MKCVAVGLGLWLAWSAAWAQQVWRCEVDGQVRYTDRPCDKDSPPLPARALQPNGAEGPASAASQAAEAASEVPAVAPAASQPVIQASTRRAGQGRNAMAWNRVAMQGLLQTDFVQRGYVPRRQNPASKPTP